MLVNGCALCDFLLKDCDCVVEINSLQDLTVPLGTPGSILISDGYTPPKEKEVVVLTPWEFDEGEG